MAGETCRYLGHLTKIALVDVSGDAVVRLRHVLADENEGVGRGEQREQFVLLRLVVEDLRFRLSADQKVGGFSALVFDSNDVS